MAGIILVGEHVLFSISSPILRETWQVMKWVCVRVNGSQKEVILSLLTTLVLDCGVTVDCRDYPVGSTENKTKILVVGSACGRWGLL